MGLMWSTWAATAARTAVERGMATRARKRFTEADLATLKARVVTVSAPAAEPKPQKPAKYRNEKVTDSAGITHDSKREHRRWEYLVLLQNAGAIRELERQVAFELAPAVVLDGRRKPALRYVSDHVYVDAASGERIVEDVKSAVTRKNPVYRIKKHLMATVHNIVVREV